MIGARIGMSFGSASRSINQLCDLALIKLQEETQVRLLPARFENLTNRG
jgi:hypothetical protein